MNIRTNRPSKHNWYTAMDINSSQCPMSVVQTDTSLKRSTLPKLVNIPKCNSNTHTTQAAAPQFKSDLHEFTKQIYLQNSQYTRTHNNTCQPMAHTTHHIISSNKTRGTIAWSGLVAETSHIHSWIASKSWPKKLITPEKTDELGLHATAEHLSRTLLVEGRMTMILLIVIERDIWVSNYWTEWC